MLKIILFDLDQTILDFKACEKAALSDALLAIGVCPDDEMISKYSAINDECWKMLEKGEITREILRTRRFERLFAFYRIAGDPVSFADSYMDNLSRTAIYMDGAQDVLRKLSETYDLYAVTNGYAQTQRGRIESAGLSAFFKDFFISEEIGCVKPESEFFERCARKIPSFDKADCVLVGDSLTSDIKGGAAFGVKTIWLCGGKPLPNGAVAPDFTINDIKELPDLIAAL